MKAAFLALIPAFVSAAVLPAKPLDERVFYNPTTFGSYATISSAVLNSWAGAAYYTAAAYCDPAVVKTWTCGASCTALGSGTTVLAQGGDNSDVPYYYVAYNGSQVIVAIKGTNSKSLESWANDLEFAFTTPSSTWFPGSPGQVHSGFYDTFKDLQPTVYTAVAAQLALGHTNILVTGHSLGAATAQILAVYLQNTFSTATVTVRAFAPPRAGNPTWATYVDAKLGVRSQFMVVAEDLVPHLPTLLLNYRHSSNEVWMPSASATSTWRACQGQENDYCSDSVSDSGSATISSQHSGPYAGVTMSC